MDTLGSEEESSSPSAVSKIFLSLSQVSKLCFQNVNFGQVILSVIIYLFNSVVFEMDGCQHES